MATVTGFTAERMLEIENSTVVDGEVVGNDLHLLQRDGTPINAGNVRGPQGIQGIPGTDGTDGLGVPAGGLTDEVLAKTSDLDNATLWVPRVKSVNTQTSGDVMAPRIFANPSNLAAWMPADGAVAYVTSVNRNYVRIGGVWCRNPDYGVYTGTADANGRLYNIPHSVGKIPSILLVHGWGGSFTNPIAESMTSTTFQTRSFTMAGLSPGAVSLNIAWTAFP